MSNFRAVRNAAVDIENLTILIGENNAGKSAFLAALDLFFASSPRLNPADFYGGDEALEIGVTIEFADLTIAEQDEFQSNLIDDRLIVTRSFRAGSEGGAFSVDRLVNADFTGCRDEQAAREKRALYDELRAKYALPSVSRADEIEDHLDQWESENSSALTRERVSGFKGFKNVAAGKLKKFTGFVFVPAVKDAAADIGQSRTSPVKQLIDELARQTIENKEEFKEFMASASARLRELTSPDSVESLARISEGLSDLLSQYYGDSKLSATWQPIGDLPVSMPATEISVSDHGYQTNIEGVGHGLQRAIILAVLQYLAEHDSDVPPDGAFDEAQSDIIIAIEEPELYQHPTKQRLFKDVFRNLVKGFNEGTGIRIQIIYTTHSPLLFDFPDFHRVRSVRRSGEGEIPPVTVTRSDLKTCASRLAQSIGRNADEAYSESSLLARLHVFNSEIAEGFFGRVVVLIEGAQDRALMEAFYRTIGRDPHAEGIVFSNVEGKSKLDRPIVIFNSLGIPTYAIFDNDKKYEGKPEKLQKIAVNRQLQRLCGISDSDAVDWPVGVHDRFCAWEPKIEDYLKECAGEEELEYVLKAAQQEFCLERKDCLKTPAVASSCLVKLRDQGITFPHFDQIVAKVDALIGS